MSRRRATSSPLDEIAHHLDSLSQDELREVQAIVEVLLTAKDEPAGSQEEKAIVPGIHQGPKGGKGHIEVKMIPDTKRGKTYGPYRYLRYWQDGKLRTRYLGKAES